MKNDKEEVRGKTHSHGGQNRKTLLLCLDFETIGASLFEVGAEDGGDGQREVPREMLAVPEGQRSRQSRNWWRLFGLQLLSPRGSEIQTVAAGHPPRAE